MKDHPAIGPIENRDTMSPTRTLALLIEYAELHDECSGYDLQSEVY